MNIRLKSLKLRNFKGVKDFTLDINCKSASIFGDNATGKTTIVDTFMWLLFDKDSTNRKDFGIKTLDKNNDEIHGLEHEVEGIFEVDNSQLMLKKIYKEKWTKRRGEFEKQLTGHTTDYWINEVPSKKKEYDEKIKELVNEDIFKLITNPLYFNQNIKWQDRRNILMQIIGDISDKDVINSKDDLKELANILNDKSIDDIKKINAERKKKYNEQIKAIPIRIDEITNNQPVLDSNIDYEALEQEKADLKARINKLDTSTTIDNSSLSNELFDKKNRLSEIKFEHQNSVQKKLNEKEIRINSAENNIDNLSFQQNSAKENVKNYNAKIKKMEERRVELLDDWQKIREEKMLEFTDTKCPMCGQELPAEEIEEKKKEFIDKFNENKKRKLNEIEKDGKEINNTKEKLEKMIIENNRTIEEAKEKIEVLNKSLENYVKELRELKTANNPEDYRKNEEYIQLTKEVEELEEKAHNQESVIKNQRESISTKKMELNSRIDEINSILVNKENIEKSNKRIEDLKEEERKLAEEINNLDKQQYLIEQFTRTKVDMLESKINSKFKHAKFKLFNTLVNGGIEECCETLYQGVPFGDLNNAAKVNIGLDIINTLTSFYNVQAPIFIDNREAVNKIIDTESQVINLIVSKDKNLKVEVM